MIELARTGGERRAGLSQGMRRRGIWWHTSLDALGGSRRADIKTEGTQVSRESPNHKEVNGPSE